MKNHIFLVVALILLIGVESKISAQVTIESNVPAANAYLGWNAGGANGNLDFRTNNVRRMRIMLGQTLNINGGTISIGGNAAFGNIGATTNALAKIHIYSIGGASNTTGYREWMNAGQLFSIDRADMFVGAVKLPSNGEHCAIINFTRGDDQPSGTLRFITTDGDGSGQGRFSQDGLEVARMTDVGFTGIGVCWETASKPLRTLDVLGKDDFPQFRITKTQASQQGNGVFADFQAHSDGNLFIKPLDFDNFRTTVIGALPGDITNPVLTVPYMALDVVGETRIRQIETEEAPDCIILGKKAASNVNEDMVLKRMDFPLDQNLFLNGNGSFSEAADKDWEYNSNHVWTGHGTNGFPSGKVGVGLNPVGGLLGKFLVKADGADTENGVLRGINCEVSGTSELSNIAEGFYLTVGGGNQLNRGLVTLISSSSGQNIGHGMTISGATSQSSGFTAIVSGGSLANSAGRFVSTGSSATNIGMFAEATGGTNNYGAYAGAPTTTGSAAAYINGNATITGSFIPGSDINLKTEIQPINEASSLLFSLQPKSYFFSSDVPNLNLSDRMQFGLIAQEVEEVMPWLVHDLVRPASYDSIGNMTVEPFHYKGVSYLDFIALLIAGFQEQSGIVAGQAGIIENQSTQLEAQAATIAELESKVESMELKMQSMYTIMQSVQTKTNNCCNDGTTGSLPAPTGTTEGVKLMQNVPNPFDTTTRIDFILPADANVVLELSDVNGRPLRRLIDGQMNAGQQSIVLDGSSLASGMYYYTVYANGELITKKMVKK